MTGTGAIGQLILQLVLNAGAGETLVVETSRLRRDVAWACGAAQAIAPGEVPGIDRLYDVVFDCTGAPGAFAVSLALVVPGGRVVVLGSYPVADLAGGNRPRGVRGLQLGLPRRP
ncbi:MAG: zinc-binding dehydrogenase [Streptosporangiaceae bacterium]